MLVCNHVVKIFGKREPADPTNPDDVEVGVYRFIVDAEVAVRLGRFLEARPDPGRLKRLLAAQAGYFDQIEGFQFRQWSVFLSATLLLIRRLFVRIDKMIGRSL